MRLPPLVLGGAATDSSGRRCTQEAPRELLSRWMDAEREAQAAVMGCHARPSEDRTAVEASAG